jgi:hypothetical protein
VHAGTFISNDLVRVDLCSVAPPSTVARGRAMTSSPPPAEADRAGEGEPSRLTNHLRPTIAMQRATAVALGGPPEERTDGAWRTKDATWAGWPELARSAAQRMKRSTLVQGPDPGPRHRPGTGGGPGQRRRATRAGEPDAAGRCAT